MKFKTTPFSKRFINIKLNRTAVFVTLAVLLVLSVPAYGAVRVQQAKTAEKAAAKSQAAARLAEKQAADKAFKEVQTELNKQTAKTVGACDYIATLKTNKTFGKQIVMPVQCQ